MDSILNMQINNEDEFVITEDDLIREFDYIVAEQLLKKLLENGLITIDESNKISKLNAQKFSPKLTAILPTNP